MAASKGKGDTWFVDTLTGEVLHVTNGPEADILDVTPTFVAYPTQAAAQKAAQTTPGHDLANLNNDVSTGIDDITGGIGEIFAFPKAVADWISNRQNIFRIVKVIAGTLMILLGLDHIEAVHDAAGTTVSLAKAAGL